MPLKIRYPKQNARHKQKLLIIQGQCDNSARITGKLTNSAGLVVQGQALVGQNPRYWGILYRNLGQDNYKFTLTQTNSPEETVTLDFGIDPPPPLPPAGTPPTVTSPAAGDTITGVFFPFGTSSGGQQITNLQLTGNMQLILGAVTQQPDINGDWIGQIDAGTCPGAGGYTMNASNNSGQTSVNNLTVQS